MAAGIRRGRVALLAGALVILLAGIGIGFLASPRDDNSATSVDVPATSTVQGTPGESPTMATAEPDGTVRTKLKCSSSTPSLVVQGTTITSSFDGAPGIPSPFCAPDWDIAVTSRDVGTYYALEAMHATHGPDCAGPPANHELHGDYEDAVFSCRDHVMTAINASGYGLVYMTPGAILDFSSGEAVVKFDASTFRASGRDWFDIWITPYDENLQLPLDDWLPDLQGEPRNAIHVRMEGPLGDTKFRAWVIRDFVATELPANFNPMESFLKPDETRRDAFELRISAGHLAFGMPGYNRWWIDTSIAPLSWASGVVQLGQHAYNPTKDPGGQPGTVHWDNLVMSPATLFNVLHADYRYADGNGQAITFDAPAPADSHLRFSAVGLVDVSFDGGKSWTRATRQAQEMAKPEHFSSYWMPVPAGTREIRLRGQADDWFNMWFAKDFTIWSKS